MSFDDFFRERLAEIKSQGRLRSVTPLKPTSPTVIECEGETLINFSSNSYLGLHEHPDLRRASIDMAAKHAGILAYARALHYWQYRHAFCGICGSPSLLRSAGHRMLCSDEECARESYPRIDPAIIVLVTHKDHCLLGRNA